MMTGYDKEDDETEKLGRMDFQIEVQMDKTTNSERYCLVPDPRRYETASINGEDHYVDRYLRTAISKSLMFEVLAKQIRNLPFFALTPTIDSMSQYAAARKSALANELEGGAYVPPVEKPIAHRELNISEAAKNLVFLSFFRWISVAALR